MPRLFSAGLRDETGATAIEYCLIASSIALVIVGVVTLVGGDVAELFKDVADRL